MLATYYHLNKKKQIIYLDKLYQQIPPPQTHMPNENIVTKWPQEDGVLRYINLIWNLLSFNVKFTLLDPKCS